MNDLSHLGQQEELVYHLHVLLWSADADRDARLLAAGAISHATRGSVGKLDSVFADLLKVYDHTPDETSPLSL